MPLLTFLPEPATEPMKQKPKQQKKHVKKQKQNQPTSSWDQIKNLLTCKQIEGSKVHDPSKMTSPHQGYSKLSSSCNSICSFRDVVHGNARVVHRADNSPESSTVGQETTLLRRKPTNGSLSGSTRHNTTPSSSSKTSQFRKLSGCYECHAVVDPNRYPSSRTAICACSQCGEVFPKIESLELHRAVRHAVSELGPENSGRNIVEIIFKSSWLKKDNRICKIERILKIHNTQRTIQRFEDCRDAVKTHTLNSSRKNPRCAADGNELLRFHCTSMSCSLGARGSSSLCGSIPGCGVCTVIRQGFQKKGGRPGGIATATEFKGVCTTASSGRAHDSMKCTDGRRAMLVCRVIAGRIKRATDDASPPLKEENNDGVLSSVGNSALRNSEYDSVAAYVDGVHSNLEELVVFNPRAILPCFVVIYKALEY